MQKKVTKMPVTDTVIKKVEETAVKDVAVKEIAFKIRKGFKYAFDNDKEYKMLVELDDPAPFLDIPAVLTELEEEYGIDKIMQDEPKLSDKQQVILAAENSGLDFLSVPTKLTSGVVIKILDNE